MATTNLGAVSMTAGGAYNAETVYKRYKVVSANGGSYMYINPTPAAGVPVTDTSHWQQIASVGGQDLVDAAVAARDAARGYKDAAAASAAQLAAGTASPAGTYANLAALNSGTPTAPNVSKIYITLDDGKWCYWNGSAWVAGGVYQATERPLDTTLSVSGMAADAKVTGDKVGELKSAIDNIYPVKTAFVSGWNKNRFDGNSVAGYLSPTGEIASGSDWKTTSLVYVGDLTKAFFSGKRILSGNRESINSFFLCTYDSNGVFIEQPVSTYPDTYTVGNNVAYIKFSYHGDTFTDIQVEPGAAKTDYVEYNYSAMPETLSDRSIKLASQFSNSYVGGRKKDITSDFTITNGYIHVNSGIYYSYANAESTDYISIYEYSSLFVTGAPLYSSNCLYALYDSSKALIASYKNNTVETDYHFNAESVLASYPNAQFVRFSSITASGGCSLVIKKSIGELWTGEKWVCVGDSLTEENSRTTKHYYDYVKEVTDITVTVMGVSGTGYWKSGSSGHDSFWERISNVPTDADVITIFGSFNDLSGSYTLGTKTDTGTSTIGGCINTTLDNLFTRCPLAVVGIVTPTPWIYANPLTEPNNASAYIQLIKDICDMRSIPCLDLFHESLLRPWDSSFRALAYSKDDENGVHPDETGHKIIAPRFKGFLDSLLL